MSTRTTTGRSSKAASHSQGLPLGVPAGVVTESDELLDAGIVRREPYLFLFPLGALLSWAGVLHWFLHAVGLLENFRPIFHSLVQIQGFLMCFAVGFLFTMIPRRTGSSPPAAWEMGVALTAPPAIALAAWLGRVVLTQVLWLALAATVIVFTLRRFLSATSRRSPPNSFVWIPMALLMGIAGSLMIAIADGLGTPQAWVEGVGRGLLLQGMFTCLVLGVGSLALPLMTRGVAPPDGSATGRDVLVRAVNVAGGLLLFASFFIEERLSLRLGMSLRAGVALAVLLGAAQIWRLPREAWNGRVIWIAAWQIPIGYLLAAIFPTHFRAGLHLAFIGGFALLALAVSTHVTLGHGGREDLIFGKPAPLLAMAGLMLLAVVPRALMEIDPQRFFAWMAAASVLFLCSTLLWGAFLTPAIVGRVRRKR